MPTLLSTLANYKARPGWYTKIIKSLAADLFTALSNSVTTGGVASLGTETASTLPTTVTVGSAKLAGTASVLPALTAQDILADSAPVEQAIYQDGSDATGITLASDETAFVTLVATNSDAAGDVLDPGTAAVYVAVIAGTSTTYSDATAALGRGAIQDALDASTGVHDGGVSFVTLAEIAWTNPGGTPAATLTVTQD